MSGVEGRVCSLGGPLSPTFCEPALGARLSIRRLNLPPSVDGLRSLTTSSLPVSRVLVIVQTMSEPYVTLTFSGPALSPDVDPAGALALAVSTQEIDFW